MISKSVRKNILWLLPLTVLLCAACVTLCLPSSSVASASLAGEDVILIAGKSMTAAEITAITDGFAAKGAGLGTAGGVSTAREIILFQDYTAASGNSRVVYNFAESKYFAVGTEFYSAYVTDDAFRKLGAPVTEQGTFALSGKSKTATITAGNYTAQIFEKGVIVKNGSTVTVYVGGVEKLTNGYKLHPVLDDQDVLALIDGELKYFGNVDGALHPLKDAEFLVDGDGFKLYANYSGCCAYVEYNSDYSISSQLIYAAKNFFKVNGEYKAEILPSSCIDLDKMVCDGDYPVADEALAYYKTVKADGTKDSLIQLFEDCYSELLSKGFVAGYRCSKIKMWDLLVLDLKFGDGTTGFSETGSGDRERMTCLVYNPVQNKVYPVYNYFFTVFKEDEGLGRNTLGYPESGVYADKTIGGITYKEIQIYQNGYVYRTETGNYIGELGYVYDATTNAFVASATPSVPDRYGVEIARATKDGAVYINYEKGAIKCELTANKSKYYYTFFNGRNFNLDGDFSASLLAQNGLFKYADLISKGAMPNDANRNEISFNDVIKPLLYEKYTNLFNDGYFCGFAEEEFKGAWNNVFAQQFVVGDSSSMIFGEERPYVSALVYNPRTGKVYLLKNDVIKTWQAVYGTAGAPTSDEYQVSGCDIWFQTFDFGMTIRKGNLIVFTEDFTSPEAYVQELKNNPLAVPTHNGNQADGYVG